MSVSVVALLLPIPAAVIAWMAVPITKLRLHMWRAERLVKVGAGDVNCDRDVKEQLARERSWIGAYDAVRLTSKERSRQRRLVGAFAGIYLSASVLFVLFPEVLDLAPDVNHYLMVVATVAAVFPMSRWSPLAWQLRARRYLRANLGARSDIPEVPLMAGVDNAERWLEAALGWPRPRLTDVSPAHIELVKNQITAWEESQRRRLPQWSLRLIFGISRSNAPWIFDLAQQENPEAVAEQSGGEDRLPGRISGREGEAGAQTANGVPATAIAN